MSDKKRNNYIYPIPGAIRGMAYSVNQPKVEISLGHMLYSGPFRPVFTSRKAFIDHRDESPLFLGTRYFGYAVQRHGNPNIYTVSKSTASKSKKEQILDTIAKAIEDTRIASLIDNGETFIEKGFHLNAVREGYIGSINERLDRVSQQFSRLEYRFLLTFALSGFLPFNLCAIRGRLTGKQSEWKDEPEYQMVIDRLIDHVGHIRAYVQENRHDPEVAIEAAIAFHALFEFEASAMKLASLAFAEGMLSSDKRNIYQTVPESKEDENIRLTGGKGSSDERLLSEKNEKGVIDSIMSELRDTSLSGLKGVNFNIEKLRMPITHHRFKGRGKVASDFGIVPRYMERFAFGPIFHIKAKAEKGCSVLIDNSGSMSFNQGQIVDICKAAPAATIASYNSDGYNGTLFILAHNGKMAKEEDILRASIGGANTIDTHSLLWLEKQVGPRYWVSDGQVTGRGDCGFSGITEYCKKIQRRANIKRVSRLSRITEIADEIKRGKKV